MKIRNVLLEILKKKKENFKEKKWNEDMNEEDKNVFIDRVLYAKISFHFVLGDTNKFNFCFISFSIVISV